MNGRQRKRRCGRIATSGDKGEAKTLKRFEDKKYSKTKQTVVILLLVTAMSFAGCGQTESSGTAATPAPTAQAERIDTGFVVTNPDSYDSADTAVLVDINNVDNTVTLLNLDLGKRYTLSMDGTTRFADKYGKAISLSQLQEGDIVELETGKKLGKHRGYWFHTIGQRKGLGLGGGPWFVVRKDVEENVIYVSRGCDTALQYGYEFRMYDFHFITDNPWKGAQEEVEVTFKIRHTPEFVKGRLQKEAEGYRIVSEEKLQGIAPGQFGVVYDADARLCVGSGEIYI